jgi:hypothetical protein
MADLNGFDANDVPPTTSSARTFDLLPEGPYEVIAIESEMRQARNGNGTYLEVEFEIVSGEHRGRRLWDRFMMEHVNPKAVGMGRLKLASLCRAVGIDAPGDSCELHYEPVTAQVVQEIRKDTGETVNRVKGYEAVSKAGTPGPRLDRPSPNANGHAGGTSRKPWERLPPI